MSQTANKKTCPLILPEKLDSCKGLIVVSDLLLTSIDESVDLETPINVPMIIVIPKIRIAAIPKKG